MTTRASTSPLIVAHRGDSAAYRENTLTAFRSAIDLSADRVELDVRTTADGVSIVLHDRTLLRVWGVDAVAGELTWAQVAPIGYADVRIPRLLDALRLFVGTGVGVLIDVLTVADARAAWAVVEPFEAAGADLEVHWCGEPVAMAEIRRLSPGAIVYLATDTGTADGATLMSLRPTYLNMEGVVATPSVVTEAHAMGLGVSVWTIDEPEAMRYFIGLGVDSITTNEVRALREVIATPGPAIALAPPPQPDAETAPPTELEVARDLGGWAAAYLRTARPENVTTKAHAADFVTSVDRDVERRVRDVIGSCFPDHGIVGEEEGGTPVAGRPTWYLDPVDGTTNFAHGLGWSSFSLALAVDRTPRLGVVADPWRRQVLWGAVGMGAYADGAPLVAAGPSDGLTGALLLTEWAAHAPWPGMLDLVAELGGGHVTPRIMGSGTLSLANVAAGRAAAAVIGDFNPIDHLAGVILAVEAGAQVYDANGEPSRFPGAGPFLVAAPQSADPMRAAFVRHCVRRP